MSLQYFCWAVLRNARKTWTSTWPVTGMKSLRYVSDMNSASAMLCYGWVEFLYLDTHSGRGRLQERVDRALHDHPVRPHNRRVEYLERRRQLRVAAEGPRDGYPEEQRARHPVAAALRDIRPG